MTLRAAMPVDAGLVPRHAEGMRRINSQEYEPLPAPPFTLCVWRVQIWEKGRRRRRGRMADALAHGGEEGRDKLR